MKKHLKDLLILGLFFLSVGGTMLHMAVHPISKNAYGYIPLVSGIAASILIPIFFMFRKTLHLANILNGFTVIIGTITMAYFSFVKHPIYPDIIMLWSKFFVGYVIFRLELHNVEAPEVKITGLRLLRYPNMGFWFVHLFALVIVFTLGNMLWR